MGRKKNYEPVFRAKVAIEAMKGTKTISQIASEHKIHANLVTKWKKELISNIPTIFQKQTNKEMEEEKTAQTLIDSLYRKLGTLKVENDFYKKKLMI